MQKRSEYEIISEPVRLPAACPIVHSDRFVQSDRSIVYLHRHDTWEFGYCYEGSGIFIIGGENYTFSAGDAVAIPPGVPHLAQSSKATLSIWRWTYLDFALMLANPFPLLDLDFLSQLVGGRISAGEELPDALKRLQNARPLNEEQTAGTVFLISALRQLPSDRNKRNNRPESAADLDRIAPALRFLSEHFGEKIVFASLGERCGMSTANFRKTFVRAIGMPPRDYAASLRLARAKALLLQNIRPISEIATECGYETLSCFHRQFRAHTGIAPGTFRKKRPQQE